MTARTDLLSFGILLAALSAGSASCARTPAPPPPEGPPPVAVPNAFSQPGVEAVDFKWWLSLGDARLNALIDRALSGNLNLAGAWARLAQAQASARRAGADAEASLTADAGAARSRADGSGRGSHTTNDFSLGLAVSYELDLWGRVRSTRDAAEMDLRATRADLDAAAITLSARVAGTWYALLHSTAHIALLDEQIGTNEKVLQIVSLQVRKRQAGITDLLQQRQQLATTQSLRVLALARREVLELELAVLLGKAPGGKPAQADAPLPALPPLPKTGLPADLVWRRPDVRAAALRLAAADHTLAAAVADTYPRISLTARASTDGPRTRDLFDNWLGTLAANLTAPILDGGRRDAEIDRTRAVGDQRLTEYGQSVLNALEEVENALVRERRHTQYLASLRRQLDLSQQTIDQTRQEYIGGARNYLRVLDAQRSHQRLQVTILAERLQLIEFRIALYRALAGGWALERPERPKRPVAQRGAATRPTENLPTR